MISDIEKIIFQTLWYYLPAIAANMIPVIIHRLDILPSLFLPLDGGKTWQGIRILGNHKTVRGTLGGLIAAVIIGYIQYQNATNPTIAAISLLGYTSLAFSLWQAFLLGFGALAGDAAKSFFKRRLHIAEGKSWVGVDQIDYIIGSTIISLGFQALSTIHIITAFILLGLGSYATSVIGVRLHVKRSI